MSENLLETLGKQAKAAALLQARATIAQKDQALKALIEALGEPSVQKRILDANLLDLEAARLQGLEPALLDRLSLQGRLEGLRKDLEQVRRLSDPIGESIEQKTLANGLFVERRRVPIGVLGVIYEARPNVTLDVAALTIKTGNCAILRGGAETLQTNQVLVELIQQALKSAQLPKEVIQLIPSAERSLVTELLHLQDYVDLIIPRGGAGLHRFCRQESRIPVITGGIGICHLYVDQTVDIAKSVELIHNAKTQRPTVCNALDTLLVHRQIAKELLPPLVKRLKESYVKLKTDEEVQALLKESYGEELSSFSNLAKEGDWDTEWLSLTLGIRLVDGLEQAIEHIQKHSSGHSDGILTDDLTQADSFLNAVDSAAVYHNASTRFTDGGQLGLGAEVAISTQKIHARGPMGLNELTSYKWVIRGAYHTREA